MKILLVDPACHRFLGFHRHYFPLGLAHLAGELNANGHDVLIYDAEHDPTAVSSSVMEAAGDYHFYLEALKNKNHPLWTEFIYILDNFKPHLVGFSTLSVKIGAVLIMAELVKEFDSQIITIVGGDHPTVRPQDLLRNNNVDFAVRGEGEKVTVDLISCLENKGNPRKVLGISWKETGGIINTAPMPLIKNLDNLALPLTQALYKENTYRPIDMGLMITERGCPYGCTFCGLSTIWGRKVRCHSIKRITDEIIRRKERYGTEYFSFRNGTFTLSKERVISICRELNEAKLDIKWECLTRVDHLDRSLLEKMTGAGCSTIRIGIESGSEKILRYIGKNISLSQIRKAAALLNRNGIFWAAYFMLGVPEETEDTVQETLNLMQEINPPFITLAKYTPIPGTPMYQEVVAAGLLDEDKTDWIWSLNQSFDKAFVKRMKEERFLELMKKVAQFVKEHNDRQSKSRRDARLKLS